MASIQRILIANRGEIAVRIARTARKLGITSIAIHSEADKDSLHARMCDEQYSLGTSDSYLDLETILSIARQSRADAIHPGYGFLSEQESFPVRCKEEGIIFIGPSSEAMLLLGGKSTAKELAQRIGIPTITGESLDGLSSEESVSRALSYGFPLIIKASFGGGGRGIRIVSDQSQLLNALESASREAATFFSRGNIFIERYLLEARHIEVQVIGDGKGDAVTVGDRDCSLQRNHQKIIEEAPAPHLPDETRNSIHDAARELFKAAHYQGLGTAEFLVTADGEFFFLEANTRLQVEHPVTEEIYRTDLVACQIRIAEGVKLDSLSIPNYPTGHCIEARLCAEVPEMGFVASTGVLKTFMCPTNLTDGSLIRLDSGFVSGDRISHLYDSLIAKIIVLSSSRERALSNLMDSLRAIAVNGIRTNRNYLLSLLGCDEFTRGNHHTQTASTYIPDTRLLAKQLFEAAIKYLDSAHSSSFSQAPSNVRSDHRALGWRSLIQTPRIIHLEIDGELVTVKTRPSAQARDARPEIELSWRDHQQNCFFPRERQQSPQLILSDDEITQLSTSFGVFSIRRIYPKLPRVGETVKGFEDRIIRSPLPGRVVKVSALAGTKVEQSETVIVLESMKMEHHISSHQAGVVRLIHVSEGQTVDRDALLFEISDEAS